MSKKESSVQAEILVRCSYCFTELRANFIATDGAGRLCLDVSACRSCANRQEERLRHAQAYWDYKSGKRDEPPLPLTEIPDTEVK